MMEEGPPSHSSRYLAGRDQLASPPNYPASPPHRSPLPCDRLVGQMDHDEHGVKEQLDTWKEGEEEETGSAPHYDNFGGAPPLELGLASDTSGQTHAEDSELLSFLRTFDMGMEAEAIQTILGITRLWHLANVSLADLHSSQLRPGIKGFLTALLFKAAPRELCQSTGTLANVEAANLAGPLSPLPGTKAAIRTTPCHGPKSTPASRKKDRGMFSVPDSPSLQQEASGLPGKKLVIPQL
jgi:hypothetical protein